MKSKIEGVYSTEQVARLCKVAIRTVARWIDSGELEGYRTTHAGSGHRRVERDKLLAFLRRHGMPTRAIEAEVERRVLIVGAEAATVAALREALPERDGFRVAAAPSGFEAGLLAATFAPRAVVVDLAIGRIEAGQIARAMRGRAEGTAVVLIALGAHVDDDAIRGLGFDEVLPNPSHVAPLAGLLKAALS